MFFSWEPCYITLTLIGLAYMKCSLGLRVFLVNVMLVKRFGKKTINDLQSVRLTFNDVGAKVSDHISNIKKHGEV